MTPESFVQDWTYSDIRRIVGNTAVLPGESASFVEVTGLPERISTFYGENYGLLSSDISGRNPEDPGILTVFQDTNIRLLYRQIITRREIVGMMLNHPQSVMDLVRSFKYYIGIDCQLGYIVRFDSTLTSLQLVNTSLMAFLESMLLLQKLTVRIRDWENLPDGRFLRIGRTLRRHLYLTDRQALRNIRYFWPDELQEKYRQ